MKKTCYCCEDPAIGQGDHVPALSFFPKEAFAYSSPIIVPSCWAHNQGLSRADEYLRLVLASSAPKVAEEVREKTVGSVLRHVLKPGANVERFGMKRTPEGLKAGPTAPVDMELLNVALEKVARGVYYHHHNGTKKLLGPVYAQPIFLGFEEDAPEEFRRQFLGLCRDVESALKERPLFGNHPDVFQYQVLELDDYVTVNLVFYQSKIAAVVKPHGA